MSPLRQLVVQSLIAIVTITTVPAYCYAEVIYQADFEQPRFVPGLLVGQDGWQNKWGGGPAMITDAQPNLGEQSIQMDGDAVKPVGGRLVGTAVELPVNFDPVANNHPIINIFADVRLDGPGTEGDLISANLSARCCGTIIASHLLSSSEDVWNGDHLTPIQLGQYYRLGLRLDYGLQESEYFLDGDLIFSSNRLAQFAEQELTTVTLELLAVDNPDLIDPSKYTAYFDNLQITMGDEFPLQLGVLQPGDANQDQSFDQLDLVKVQIAAKYLTGQAATWGEGDWNGAPGGEQGNPPAGDGMFDQLDIVSALAGGVYLTGPYEALVANELENDEQASIVYVADSGEVRVDAPAAVELTSINIDSAAGIFTGVAAQNLGGSFDNDADNNIFKATFGGSFGSLSFGNVASQGLSEQFIQNELTVVGSLQGGGALGDVDLTYIPVPEPSGAVLLGLAVATIVWTIRSQTSIRSINHIPEQRRSGQISRSGFALSISISF